MKYRQYTHSSSFFWDSKLSEARKEELIAWSNSLSDEDAKKLQDLLKDTSEAVEYDCETSGY